MDPPEEDLELASLIRSPPDQDLGNGLEPPSTPTHFSSRTASYRVPRTLSRNKTILLNNVPSFSKFATVKKYMDKTSLSNKMMVLAMLAMVVGMLVIVTSDVETSIEQEVVETVVVVHHEDTDVASDVATVVDSSSSSSTMSDSTTASFSSSSSTSTSTESSSTPFEITGFSKIIGFHEPSFDNMYGPRYYFKPKGVGYPLAPTGGVHPIYMIDNPADEEGNEITPPADFDDYELSPYTDTRLKMTAEERAKEQNYWHGKLALIRHEYGYWNFKDSYWFKNKGKSRPVVDWAAIAAKTKTNGNGNPLHGEISKEDFPKDSWQTDTDYITSFIAEAKKLIHRVREGIYAEYGWASSSLTAEQMNQRNVYLGVHIASEISSTGPDKGVAWIYQDSFDALVKKLLNAMMTNDHFFVTLGGHSAAAGHGNNFFQSYMMQFHDVMEPVFDRLGMVLVTANLAQGGMGTLQAVLAGVDVYGEKDFMVWDSSMTEKGALQDVFGRMMLLSGHRVPILFDIGGGRGFMDALRKEVGAHVGGITSGNPHLNETESIEQAATLPHALKHLFCKGGLPTCGQSQFKYNATCWTDRVDVETPPTEQNKGYGGQAKWHPGNRAHQLIARRMTLLFLRALEEAMNVWLQATVSEGSPLDGKYWHLAEEEKKIRDALKNANATATPCGELMKLTPRVCNTPMRGATEWTPRYRGDESSIRQLLKPSPSGYIPAVVGETEQVYGGREAHIPQQRIPMGEVDVAMIARSLPQQVKKHRRTFSTTSEVSVASAEAKRNGQHRYSRISGSSLLRNETSHRIILGRRLADDSGPIVPGEGWEVQGGPIGYCDGTANAVCGRDTLSNCLMTGHNDGRGKLDGDALSGWVVFNLKNVTQGLFLARMETWIEFESNKRTEGWTEVNNGKRARHRYLKAPPPPKPADYRVEVAVNGVITKSMNETEFNNLCTEPGYNLIICTLWDDEERALKNEKEDVEFAFRMAGGGRKGIMGITHVYYA
eukprot:CAMPEP_0201718612 /NCGR_PEP_ID=MMETSP0593-20130828/4087_1 /ASSEMBLY_ACC=CAM_ASM_000672 /TAXON_ID=267983 /ORGANISM="Skeletonema japonicum, Strain CCMP2506" /LENGTH=996 /DNA_ID=CAMNT_0048208955 /DNA_START=5 /DNA_END=2995 /DNA_ORIENTATION=+